MKNDIDHVIIGFNSCGFGQKYQIFVIHSEWGNRGINYTFKGIFYLE